MRSSSAKLYMRSVLNSSASSCLPGLVALAAFSLNAGAIDLNHNGISDIWEQKFGAGSLEEQADADGDTVLNGQEAAAGTDPFDPVSHSKIMGMHYASGNAILSIPCSPGKLYELQSVFPFGSQWTTETMAAPLVGNIVEFSVPAGGAARFFRVFISDLDTDGDGVNDWEERQVGLDPENPASNGLLDSTGNPVDDYDFSAQQLTQHNVVTLLPSDPSATQPDPGQSPVNLGTIAVERMGFPLGTVAVNLAVEPPSPGSALEGTDYSPVPRSVVLGPNIRSSSISVAPLANPGRGGPVVATIRVLPGPGYSLGAATNASVVIYPSETPKGAGLTGHYFTNASPTYSSSLNFNPANLKLARVDPTVDFTWGTTTAPIPNNGYYCVRWSGQVQPQFSELYYFVANTDDGVRLWVNDRLIIDRWVLRSAADSSGTIELQGGVRYNIKMEYFNGTGSASARLYWYSASQPKQIIPSSRLYPLSTPAAPSAVTSPSSAVAFVGQPFSFTISGANSPAGYSAVGLPPGLVFNGLTGLISGAPLVAGDFQVKVSSSNTAGLTASVLDLRILDTGSAVSREIWTNIPGTAVGDIPLDTPVAAIGAYGGLEGITNFGEDYGERIRGYFTAPETGNYHFWIAGSDSAELWISNDSEPASKVRRAWVSADPSPAPPPANGSGPRQWNVQTTQKSPWLTMVGGERYYFEVLHKAGQGADDNWAVGWRLDSTGTNTTPAGVMPSHLLSRIFPVPPTHQPGTLYTATLVAQPGAITHAFGTATLRVSGDNSKALLKFSSSGLGSRLTGQHIHSDPYLSHPAQIIFDIDDAEPDAEGVRTWHIKPVGTLSSAEVIELLKEGRAYINLHTEMYPAGEIKGYFNLASGTQTFTPPPAPPSWTDDHSDSNSASRFLIQASFGPSLVEIASVRALGYEGWIDSQFALPATHHLPYVLENTSYNPATPYPGSLTFNAWWKHSVTAPDQLRQRTAFALSQIFVVSEAGILRNRATALSDYYDMLLGHAFGNFRDLLEAVTLHPAMGLYLDMRANQKGDIITGRHPNENYAREILQLFSIGLYRMWPDGTLVLNSADSLVPTYGQEEIMGFSSVFTGWNYYQANQANGRLPTRWNPPANYTNLMVLVPSRHDLGTKRVLDNVVLRQAWGSEASSSSTNFDDYCSQDLERALDSIFYHENVAPFICRQLIQRLVTSHPSRDYVYRVVQKFNDNGAGVRGDLKAVLKAILLDYEARSPAMVTQPGFGKQREPVLRVTAAARAFPSPPSLTGAYLQNGDRTITCNMGTAHRMNNGDTVLLRFTDNSGNPAPASQRYSITATSPTIFTVNDAALAAGTYKQYGNVTVTNMITGTPLTTNVIFVTISGHGLSPGIPAYLRFTTGGALNGVYEVIAATNNNNFAVTTADATTRSGNVRMPKMTGGYKQTGTNIVININGNHSLTAGDEIYINFTSGSAADGRYVVLSNISAFQFQVGTSVSANQTRNGLTAYPLVPPVVNRSGIVTVERSTWNVGSTDNSLSQTPLRSPTVFNFFYPDYKYPGFLSAAGMTTPEFQLTSASEIALQMNYLANGVLRNTGNTNGLSSFSSGDGDIVLDLGPWMTAAYTANSGIGTLFDRLNMLLAGGQVSPAAKTVIVNYVANTSNFPFGSPPTYTQMRNRVRAVVHLILASPDFSIQR